MKKAFLLTLVCLFTLVLPLAADAATPPYLANVQWTSVGPGGGGAQYNPVIAPGNPNLMYGFCDMGGIYRSTDGGRHWRMLTLDQAQTPVTYSPYHCNPAFNPTNGNILFVGVQGALKRTIDGGNTWTTVASGVTPQAIAIDRGAANVMYYADNANSIWKSTDSGSTWAEMPAWRTSVNETVMDLFIDAASNSSAPTVYASTETGMYKTTNGGTSWAPANGNLPSTSISDFNAGMKNGVAQLYVAVTGSGVYRSTDGGTTWTARNGGFNVAAAGHMELGLCDTNPDILYVGSQENGGPTIYKTADGGGTWTMTLTAPNAANFPAGVTVERDWMTLAFGWGWGEEPHEVEVCPTNGNIIAFSEDGRTFRSNDGGASWFCCNSRESAANSDWWPSMGFETTTNYHVHFSPWDHKRAYITYTDMGLFRSEDGGLTWRPASTGSPWRNTFYDVAFDPTTPGKMWAVASNNHDIPHEKMLRQSGLPNYTGGVLLSTDYGATWKDLGHSTGLSVGAPTSIVVDPRSSAGTRTLYVAVMGHGVYKSVNDGVSWAAANTGLGMPNNMNAWMLKLMPDGTLYCALTEAMTGTTRYPGALFKSTNAGASWTKVNASQVLPYIYGFDVDSADQNRIYVASFQSAGEGQGLWVTADGGATWKMTLGGCDMCGADIDPAVHSRVYAAMEQGENYWPQGGAYVSEDYGATWNKLPGLPFERLGPNYFSFDPDDATNVFVTTFGGGVWRATIPRQTASESLSITTASLPGGQIGAGYNQALAAAGGTTPYEWSLAAGNLPASLVLNAQGVITGTPSASGTSNFTARVIDAASTTATRALSIVVAAVGDTLTITTASLPNGVAGAGYSQRLAATGGTRPYTWNIASGSLPDGLDLAANGTIGGTPSGAGTSDFTVMIEDDAGATATAALSITIGGSAGLAISTGSLPGGTVGTAYSQTLAATGGTTPFTWTIASGSLPAGLALDTAGVISGTPTTAGTSSFTARVTDSAGATATKALSIAVTTSDPGALTITTTSLPNGAAGAAYSQRLTAAGGTRPFTWTIASGSLPDGLALAANGTISGTPSGAGTSDFTVMVEDDGGAMATAALSITIGGSGSGLAITTTSLPDGAIAAAYGQQLAATGGTPPYTWSRVSGVLPAGLALSAGGVISGTPTQAVNSNFTVSVEDQAGATATAALSITVSSFNDGLVIATASLPNGTVGTAYSQTVVASGGTAPYAWSLASGALPPGLALNAASGLIAGTPTATATSSFTIRVVDSAAATATKALSITVTTSAGGLTITTTSLPNGAVGVPYNQRLTATGGVAPLMWTLISRVLPDGLALADNGAISGTPSANGTFDFTVEVADQDGRTATAALSITIGAPFGIAITTTSLPGGTVGLSYSQTLAATGGTTPYEWSIASGALPVGLALAGDTGAITGTPTAAGTSNFTARVTDSAGATDTQALSITITGATGLAVTTTSLPDGVINAPYSQTLAAVGGAPPYTWAIVTGTLPGGLALDASTGDIAGTPAFSGTFDFIVQVTDSVGATATRTLSITISAGPTAAWRFVASDPESSTTSTDWQTKTTLAIDSSGAETWVFLAFAEYKGVSLDSTANVRFVVDGAVEGQVGNQPGDITDYLGFAAQSVKDLDAGTHTLTVEFATGDPAAAAFIRNARIVALRVPGDAVAHTFSDETEPLSGTMMKFAELRWTPPVSGKYLVIYTAEVNASPDSFTRIRSFYNRGLIGDMLTRDHGTDDYTTFMDVHTAFVAKKAIRSAAIAAAKAPKSTVTQSVRRCRITAIRLADTPFDDPVKFYATHFAVTRSTSFVERLNKSWAPGAGGNWLLLTAGQFGCGRTDQQSEVQVTENESFISAQQLRKPQATADYFNFCSIDVRDLGTSPHVDVTFRTTDSHAVAKMRGLKFIAIPLGD